VKLARKIRLPYWVGDANPFTFSCSCSYEANSDIRISTMTANAGAADSRIRSVLQVVGAIEEN
jgi:hypothetical protein